jgi:hypothetical protein
MTLIFSKTRDCVGRTSDWRTAGTQFAERRLQPGQLNYAANNRLLIVDSDGKLRDALPSGVGEFLSIG